MASHARSNGAIKRWFELSGEGVAQKRSSSSADRNRLLIKTRAWDEVVAYVGGVLDACRWRGIQARYESPEG